MAEYINPQFESDPSTIERSITAYIQTIFPDWVPRDAHVTKILGEAFSAETSELLRMTSDVPPEIFRYFGRLVGILPVNASQAVGNTTWTMINNAGYTIPAGTGLRMLVGGDVYEAFVVVSDVVVPPGSTVTGSGAVQIRAINAGAQASGLSTPVELTDILDYVASVALVGSTGGGSDAETIDDYLDRLSLRLTLLADHPIIPDDFVTYTDTVTGVARSIALDGYNPGTDTFNNDKMITMIAIDSAGAAVNATIKTNIQTLLQAAREVNFVVNTMDPTYTVVNVVASVKALPDYDLTDLDTRVTAAVIDFLNPKNWGINASGDTSIWVFEDKVRFTNLVAVIENVAGVNYISPGTLTINGSASDFTLAGRAPLPSLSSTANITVIAP